jgi:hypothetical protein
MEAVDASTPPPAFFLFFPLKPCLGYEASSHDQRLNERHGQEHVECGKFDSCWLLSSSMVFLFLFSLLFLALFRGESENVLVTYLKAALCPSYTVSKIIC